MQSFPLNRRWGFTGDIVDDAVNMGDLIDDAGGGTVEDVVGDTSPIGGHEVGGGDAAEGEGVVVVENVLDIRNTGVLISGSFKECPYLVLACL